MFPTLSKKRDSKYSISAALNQLMFFTRVLRTDADIVKVFWYNKSIKSCKEFSCFSEAPAGSELTSEMFDACDISKSRSDE